MPKHVLVVFRRSLLMEYDMVVREYSWPFLYFLLVSVDELDYGTRYQVRIPDSGVKATSTTDPRSIPSQKRVYIYERGARV